MVDSIMTQPFSVIVSPRLRSSSRFCVCLNALSAIFWRVSWPSDVSLSALRIRATLVSGVALSYFEVVKSCLSVLSFAQLVPKVTIKVVVAQKLNSVWT